MGPAAGESHKLRRILADNVLPLSSALIRTSRHVRKCQKRKGLLQVDYLVSGRKQGFPQEELISLPSDLPLLRTLQKELSQPTASKGTRSWIKRRHTCRISIPGGKAACQGGGPGSQPGPPSNTAAAVREIAARHRLPAR